MNFKNIKYLYIQYVRITPYEIILKINILILG
jgi:hypothetical protein